MKILFSMLLVSMVLFGCSTKPGSLQLTITGLPAGADASILVTGPNGFSQTVTAAITLSSLTPGSYTLVANNVIAQSSGYAGAVSASPITVSSSNTAAATVNYTAVSGALRVTPSGLPTSLNASILVTGPGGYSQQVTVDSTLSNLPPGTYTVAANPVRALGTIVDQVFSATGGSAAVSAGNIASNSVAYSLRPGTGKVWIPTSGTIAGYDASQLASSSSPTPAVVTTASGLNEGSVFDRNGNEWVTSFTGNTVKSYTPSQIAASGNPTANVTISATSGSLSSPIPLAFDSSGNLWVGNYGNATLVQYTAAQLTTSASAVPNVILSATAGSLVGPGGLAFDTGGNLWVANANNSTLVKFTAAQLASTGSPTPTVVLTASAGSLSRPFGVAFDGSGNLWVANLSNNTIVKFTSAQLASSGSPAPAVVLTASAGSLNGPCALAFDNGASLWVYNTFARTLVRFDASQLGVSGAPTPPVIVGGVNGTDIAAFTLNPPPANSPIYQ